MTWGCEWAGGLMSCDTPLVHYGSYTLHATGTGTGTRSGTIENNGSLSLSLCSVYSNIETNLFSGPVLVPSNLVIAKLRDTIDLAIDGIRISILAKYLNLSFSESTTSLYVPVGIFIHHGFITISMWYVRLLEERYVTVGVSRGYTDHHQSRGHSSRPTAVLINIHEPLI